MGKTRINYRNATKRQINRKTIIWMMQISNNHNHPTSASSSSWSWQENKIFETSLVQIPHGIEHRWEKIAQLLPEKSPLDVAAHFQTLLLDVADIEAGLIEIPCYNDNKEDEEAFDHMKKTTNRVKAQRKRGTPWTEQEHMLFLMGLERYGRGDWRSISRNLVVTRQPQQVASHAQKFFNRQMAISRKKERKRSSIHDITASSSSSCVPLTAMMHDEPVVTSGAVMSSNVQFHHLPPR